MKAEWDRATEVVEMLNMEQESNRLFEDIVEAGKPTAAPTQRSSGIWTGTSYSSSSSRTPPSVERAGGWTRVEVTYFHRDREPHEEVREL